MRRLEAADTTYASAPHGQPIVPLSDNASPTDPEGLCARTYREEESIEEFLLTIVTPIQANVCLTIGSYSFFPS